MSRVCGVPDRPIRLCKGVAAYGGPRTALWCLFWVVILIRPSVGFRVHYFMVARSAYDVTC